MAKEKLLDDETYKSLPEYSTFKGRPVISLPLVEGSSIRFTFGLSKAPLILEYIDEINDTASCSTSPGRRL